MDTLSPLNAKQVNENVIHYLIQQIQNPVIHLSPEFIITEFNPAAENIYQWQRSEVVHQNYFKLFEQHQLTSPLSKDMLLSIKQQSAISIQDKINHAGQIISWSIVLMSQLSANHQGYLLLGKIQTQPTDSVVRQEDFELLKSIVAHLPCHAYWKDMQGVYIGCNDRMAAMSGLNSRHEVVGKTDYDLSWKDIAGELQKNDKLAIESGVTQYMEEKGKLADGGIGIFSTIKTPLQDSNGNIIGVLGVSVDITELKRVEEALRTEKERAERAETASLAKSQFMAVMNHELRTPLNSIVGTAQILRNQIKDYQDAFDDILSASHAILSIVNDVLDYSKLEAGKIELHNKPANLQEIIDETVAMMSVLSQQKGLKMVVNYKKNVPFFVIADSRRIRQILFNLIGNAVKYTDKGQIEISVTAHLDAEKNTKFCLAVKDTGIGISHDKLDFIFDRFNQINTTYSHQQGTGLGLTIVKQLVEIMGGSISVESELNKGSIFSCYFKFPVIESL